MLVLSRKKNESLVIGSDIEVVVVDIRGDKVRLGIQAPYDVPVHRREVYDAILRREGGVRPGKPQSPDTLTPGRLAGAAAVLRLLSAQAETPEQRLFWAMAADNLPVAVPV